MRRSLCTPTDFQTSLMVGRSGRAEPGLVIREHSTLQNSNPQPALLFRPLRSEVRDWPATRSRQAPNWRR